MRFSTLAYALLPLLALAEETTTLTSTATITRTITVSEVVASVYSTVTSYSPGTTIGTVGSTTRLSSTTPTVIPQNFMGAASNLSPIYAGSAGVMMAIAAALL